MEFLDIFLVAWFPMLALIAVWVIYMRRAVGKSGGLSQMDYMKALLEETKKQNQSQERIAIALEKIAAKTD